MCKNCISPEFTIYLPAHSPRFGYIAGTKKWIGFRFIQSTKARPLSLPVSPLFPSLLISSLCLCFLPSLPVSLSFFYLCRKERGSGYKGRYALPVHTARIRTGLPPTYRLQHMVYSWLSECNEPQSTVDHVVTYLFHDHSPDGDWHPSILSCKLQAVTRETKLTLSIAVKSKLTLERGTNNTNRNTTAC